MTQDPSRRPTAPVDPTTAHPRPPQPAQTQTAPGLAGRMQPRPDHGEESYVGTGRLTGRRAVVTGADSGIGRAVAIAFAREGADVVLGYLPAEQADADEVIALVEQAGRRAVPVPGDLGTEGGNTALVQTAVETLGGIDILVSVAGVQTWVDDIADLSTEQFDRTFKVNVYGLFWLTRAALPHMGPGGSIVATSSVQAYRPSPGLLDYATTKAAINTYAKALAQQVAARGIRVNVVAPGPFWTPLQVTGGQPADRIPDFGDSAWLGRAGQPAEIAAAYIHLAGDESSYTTGATLSVTGGNPTP